ncbi:MAG: hypothetical protein C0604_00920 [Clostridiales bacterium]|nr:MAG: hypothetical protein C0604_00920 [Clostridiales bacterium]
MDKGKLDGIRKDIFMIGILAGLFVSSFFNYLLFHSLVGIYGISIAFAVFMVAWNSRKYNKGSYIIFLGIAYLFIGFIDLMHLLSFKDLTVFAGQKYFAGQFWIAARAMESLTLLIAFKFNKRLKERINYEMVFSIYFAATLLICTSILNFNTFPSCCVEGSVYTPFKLWSEAAIVLMLLTAWFAIDKNRLEVGEKAYPFLVWAIVFTLLSELSFLIDAGNHGLLNLVGQFMKLSSFYMIYKVAIDLGIKKPHDAFFRELKQNENSLKDVALIDLETGLFNNQAYQRIKGKLWVLFKKCRTVVGIALLTISDFEKLEIEYGKRTSLKILEEFVEIIMDEIPEDHFFFRMDTNTFLILFGEEEERMKNYAETIRKRFVLEVKSKYGIEANLHYGISENDSLLTYSIDNVYESANENLSRKKLRYVIQEME